jgi:hypothetical protein
MARYVYSKEVKEEGMINTPDGYVYCFRSDGHIGVMSATKVYIPAAFDAIEIIPTKERNLPFFAIVEMNDKYGVVSCKNELLLECVYDEIMCYENSSTFQIVLDNDYYAVNFLNKVEPFKVCKDYNCISDFITFTDRDNYQKELARNGLDNRKYAIVERNRKYGIILDDGTLWIDSIFDKMSKFRVYNSPYLVGIYAEVYSNDGNWSYIDYKGLFYGIIPSYEYNMAIKLLYENRYIVRNKDNMWGIVDGSNNVISDFRYTGYVKHLRSPLIHKTSAEIFMDNEGYVLVSLSNGEQLTCHYDHIQFDGWYYKVQNNSKYGVLNKNGQCLVPCEYDLVGSLGGDIFVIKDGIKGHIVNGIFVPYNQEENVTKAVGTTRHRKERPTYNNYNGSYAQDEMGYSDDDIDTIFDGDPSAYWNID